MIEEGKLTFALLLSFFLVGSAHTGQIDCVYDGNAEWPWVEERVCQSKVPAAALLANDAQSSSWPDCKLNSSDPDGDGWGWENGQSCRVAVGVPKCLDPGSDPDGDGWGWENGKSCIHKVKEPPPSQHPACGFIASDPDGDGWGFENGKSCRITSASKFPICSDNVPDYDGDGWGYENRQSCRIKTGKESAVVVYQQDYDNSTPGPYSGAALNKQWDTPFWHLGFTQGRVHIVTEPGRGNAMRVRFPANAYGAAGASAFLTDVQFGVDLPKSYEELFVSYDVKFAHGFDFVRGGKLPGLCGYNNTQLPFQGCNTGGGFPSGYDGWSARGMWREGGVMENYIYHAAQKNFYGDDEYWDVSAIPGQWHRVQHRVVLNTVGQENGILEAWFDGSKVLSKNNLVYRKSKQVGINLFYFSTFFGGNDPSWAPTEDQYIYFDNFRIATQPEEPAAAKSSAQNDEPRMDSAQAGGGGSVAITLLLLLVCRKKRLTAVVSH